MNLLILDHSDDFYGGQKSLDGFISLLNDQKNEIRITCIFNSLNYKWKNVLKSKSRISVIYLDYSFLNPIVYLIFLYKVYKCIKQHEINIVHANTFKSAIAVLPIKVLFRIKFVFRARLGIDYNSHGFIDFLINKYFDKIICNSEYVANSFRKKYPSLNAANKMHVIFNGLADDLIKRLSEKRLNQRLVIGSIGRFENIKNQEELLVAASILKGKGIQFEVRLYGSQSKLDNGLYFRHLESLINDLNIADIVSIYQYEENIANIYKGLEIVVVTSKSEALSRVCFESFFSKVPVVASDIEGNKEIITHSENGFLYDLGNPVDLANKILYIIGVDNKILVQKVISSAHGFAMNNFRASKNYTSEIELLENFVHESN